MPSDLALPGVGTFVAAAPKHAPVTAAEPIRDRRSVGELLLDADHLARTLLLDAEAQDAPELLRSWADTVAVAADLVDTLAGREYAAADSQRVVERVSGLAASISADLATARWPGAGSGDHRMRAISGNLGRARELVDKYGAEIQPHVPRVANDLQAARSRVVHILYIATHGVVVALNQDGRQRATDPTPTATPRAGTVSYRGRYEVGPGVRWADRLGVAERALGSYLKPGRYADALATEQVAPVVGLSRLRDTLAQFDIQAHRTLVEAPNAGNMVLTTRTQGMFLGAALALARAADETGQLNPSDTDSTRLRHGVNAAGEAWMGLACRWRDLMPQGARLDPALGAAAAQLRAACRELTHDGDHLARPQRSPRESTCARLCPSSPTTSTQPPNWPRQRDPRYATRASSHRSVPWYDGLPKIRRTASSPTPSSSKTRILSRWPRAGIPPSPCQSNCATPWTPPRRRRPGHLLRPPTEPRQRLNMIQRTPQKRSQARRRGGLHQRLPRHQRAFDAMPAPVEWGGVGACQLLDSVEK